MSKNAKANVPTQQIDQLIEINGKLSNKRITGEKLQFF